MRYCLHCGCEMTENARFCTKCGKQADTSTNVCPYCAEEIPEDVNVCPYCEEPLTETGITESSCVCPYCAEIIPVDTTICPFCEETLSVQNNHIQADDRDVDNYFQMASAPNILEQRRNTNYSGIIIAAVILALGMVAAAYLYQIRSTEDYETTVSDTVATDAETEEYTDTKDDNKTDIKEEEQYSENNYTEESYVEHPTMVSVVTGNGTIDGSPYRIEGEWNRDGSISGTYVNEYINTSLSFRGREVDGVLELTLGRNAGSLILENDGTGSYQGVFTKGSVTKPATLRLN